jgi:glycosyltransferase involved in cell wall biosynthesis
MAYMFHANLASRLVRRFARVPALVCSERVVEWESGWRVAINRATVRLTDAITTNSAAGVRFWADRLGVPESRVHLIYNGVDVSTFQPRSASAPRSSDLLIGNLARLHGKNGQADLLAALQQLLAIPGLPRWRCLIAGEGPEDATLAEAARRLSLEDRIEFVGHVARPERFLHDLDVYVQSSVAEGLPNAVLEAMACGLPVVATDVGGTPEVVQDSVTGFLVPARNPARIAKALTRLLADRPARLAMGSAGRGRVEETFSIEQMIRATERLLDDVVGSRCAAA